jgi:hypothetical protein
MAAKQGWQREFEDPIHLPNGRKLITLRDAAQYIIALPKREAKEERWQLAMRCLIDAADNNGIRMLARIGVMRALNRHVETAFNSPRKKTHWGKRKVARDR